MSLSKNNPLPNFETDSNVAFESFTLTRANFSDNTLKGVYYLNVWALEHSDYTITTLLNYDSQVLKAALPLSEGVPLQMIIGDDEYALF